MNRALRRVSLACLVMFVLLLVNVNWLQGFDAASLASEPGNGRTFSEQFQFQRGSIVTADQKVIAESRLNKNLGEYQRHYPLGPVYAPITGYDSLFSATGIEQAENKQLSGSDPALAVHNLIDLVTGKPKKGATVQLTINSAAQQAAYSALQAQGRQAGVVALNPQTGAVLALASYPTFDPNQLATLNGSKLVRNDKRLLRDPNQPLLNRALNDTFPPGSTFKIVTSSAAMTDRGITQNTPVYAPTKLKLPGVAQPLINFDGEACDNGSNPTGTGKVPLSFAFTVSCNTVFGNLGLQLGGAKLKQQATLYGMNNPRLAIPLPVTQSNFPYYRDPAQAAGRGDRPGKRHGDPAAGGDAVRGRGQQGHADEAVHGGQGHRTRPDPAVHHPAHRAEPPGQPHGGRRADPDDDHCDPVATGHGARHRRCAGHRDRGQDRHRADRDQQLGPGRRGFHLFCPRCQPTDSRRRRGKRRGSRRGRVRADRREDHPGLPGSRGEVVNPHRSAYAAPRAAPARWPQRHRARSPGRAMDDNDAGRLLTCET